MATSYPFNRFRYRVEIDGIGEAGFSEVTGFDASIDVIEYRTGDEKAGTPGKSPGLRRYSNVTLRWGTTDSTAVYKWMEAWIEKAAERKDVTVSLLDDEGAEIASWVITAAWPIKYIVPELSSLSSEIAIETLELAHEGLKRSK